MANIPSSFSANQQFGGGAAPLSSSPPSGGGRDQRLAAVEQLVLDLSNPELRENALLELSKKREIFQDLAPLLWNSFGTIAAILQEIVLIYPYITPPNLSAGASNRVCNALALLQCIASHSETRVHFLSAQMPLYLYPFLNTTSRTRPFEYLRLTSLGVIGALVKVDDTEVISFLLKTEIIPLCLRTMENGSELSKTMVAAMIGHNDIIMSFDELEFCPFQVATFILQKILLDDVGLHYVCATAERFFAVIQVLGNMVESLADQPPTRLLKHIIRCFLKLSDNPRACEALQDHLPRVLRDGTFDNCLRDDPATRRWLHQLLANCYGEVRPSSVQGGLGHMMGN